MLVELIDLVSDLPKIWNAETTTNRDRKELMRLLAERITVEKRDKRRIVIRVDWIGGDPPSRAEVWLPAGVADRIRVRVLDGATTDAICDELNALGARTIKGNVWSPERVNHAIWRMRKAGVLGRACAPVNGRARRGSVCA